MKNLSNMESSDEEDIFTLNNLKTNSNNREINITFSWINNKVSINSSNDKYSEVKIDKEDKHLDDKVIPQNKLIIIDIPKLTRNKDFNTVRALAIQSIWSEFELNDDYPENIIKSYQEDNTNENLEILKSDETYGLANRTRNQKLSTIQLTYLKSKIESSNLPTKKLSKEFNVSISLINKIKRTNLSQLWKGRSRKLAKFYGTEMKNIIQELKKFINWVNHAFNSIEITNHVNFELNKNYKPYFIRKLMKSELNLTFKKVKPRPNNVNFDFLKASRQLFAVKFSQFISEDTLVINIDETSINRHIKTSYSWSKKGIPYEAKNSPFSGSMNWIMAILWNENWFSMLSNKTSNSDKFLQFLFRLNYWLSQNNRFEKKDILVILDNWSMHETVEVVQKILGINWNVIFLPAYTPQFAPIEMWFSKIKGNLRQLYNRKIVKLSLKSSYNDVFNTMKHIKSEYIRLLFAEMYSTINSYL